MRNIQTIKKRVWATVVSIALCIAGSITTSAQMAVATDTISISSLKSTITLFILPIDDSTGKKNFEKVIKEVWTLTPFKIISNDDLPQYIDKAGYSYFCPIIAGARPSGVFAPPYTGGGGLAGLGVYMAVAITGNIIEASMQKKYPTDQTPAGTLFNIPPGITLTYRLFIPDMNIKDVLQCYAVIAENLSPDPAFYNERNDTGYCDQIPYKYWSAGMFKQYLKQVNTALTNGEKLKPFTDDINETALARLRTDTLYIPDYIAPFITTIPTEQLNKGVTDSIIAMAYPFPVRFVTSGQLSDRILRQGNAVNFLAYQSYAGVNAYYTKKHRYSKSKSYRNIKVYNTSAGVVYSDFPTNVIDQPKKGKNFNVNDLEKLADAVKGK